MLRHFVACNDLVEFPVLLRQQCSMLSDCMCWAVCTNETHGPRAHYVCRWVSVYMYARKRRNEIELYSFPQILHGVRAGEAA